MQNKKFNYKNFEKSFRETFIDICIRFAKCMTKSKPVEVVKVLQTNKLRKNKNGQKISSSNQSNSLENQLKSYENNIMNLIYTHLVNTLFKNKKTFISSYTSLIKKLIKKLKVQQ
jgi:hypothetical protein